MTSYLELLPKDLINLLCCYLNIRQIEILCRLPRISHLCENNDIWNFKISHEFSFMPTEHLHSKLLSPKSKYTELKSIRSVDYGSDYFTTLETYVMRGSRLQDRKMTGELIDQYLSDYVGLQLEGIASQDDRVMLQNVVDRLRGYQNRYISSVQIGYGEARKLDELVAAVHLIFKSNPTVDSDQLFLNILKGTIGSGDIEALHKYESDDLHVRQIIMEEIPRAATLQKWPMVDYLVTNYLSDNRINFDLRQRTYMKYLQILVRLWQNDRFVLLTSLYINTFRANYQGISYNQSNVFDVALESGNVSMLDYLRAVRLISLSNLTQSQITEAYTKVFTYNHLDTAVFLQKYIPLTAGWAKRIIDHVSFDNKGKIVSRDIEISEVIGMK